MVTINQIQKHYGMPIKRQFRQEIERYLNEPKVQAIISKAMAYKLSEADRDWLYEYGSWRAQYPKLNWLCTIYIHPLTIAQHCLVLADRIERG